jgi:hypothetical protein
MAKLCQITALLTGKKTAVEKAITAIYHKLQKPALFCGLTKRYTPKDEEGEKFPDERQNVQVKSKEALQEVRSAMVQLLDLTATQDVSNCVAKADVKIDGKVILPEMPPTSLLFLEKQLVNLLNILDKMPVLDPQENWTYSTDAGCYVSEKTTTLKTKKTPRAQVLYEATKEHPAQVQQYFEDVVVGSWDTLKLSGALAADERTAIVSRIEKLRDAVKVAREEANSAEAKDKKVGDAIFDYVLGK